MKRGECIDMNKLVKFKGAEERQTVWIDPEKVEGVIRIEPILSSLHLPDSNKDIIVIRTSKYSYGVSEPIDDVLIKLGIEASPETLETKND